MVSQSSLFPYFQLGQFLDPDPSTEKWIHVTGFYWWLRNLQIYLLRCLIGNQIIKEEKKLFLVYTNFVSSFIKIRIFTRNNKKRLCKKRHNRLMMIVNSFTTTHWKQADHVGRKVVFTHTWKQCKKERWKEERQNEHAQKDTLRSTRETMQPIKIASFMWK